MISPDSHPDNLHIRVDIEYSLYDRISLMQCYDRIFARMIGYSKFEFDSSNTSGYLTTLEQLAIRLYDVDLIDFRCLCELDD